MSIRVTLPEPHHTGEMSVPLEKLNSVAKRALDVIASTLLLVCAVPFLLIAFAGIRFASPGPVIYRARRAGLGGAPFEMLKFRTMRMNSGGSAITAPDDDRIFPFGRFLRATKIDELPQLVNILKGDMSLVGPRPEDPRIVEAYYDARMHESLAVRPGVTSPGTLLYIGRFRDVVSAGDSTGSYVSGILKEKLEADIRYIAEQNVFKDIMLILRTALVVLGNATRSPMRE